MIDCCPFQCLSVCPYINVRPLTFCPYTVWKNNIGTVSRVFTPVFFMILIHLGPLYMCLFSQLVWAEIFACAKNSVVSLTPLSQTPQWHWTAESISAVSLTLPRQSSFLSWPLVPVAFTKSKIKQNMWRNIAKVKLKNIRF